MLRLARLSVALGVLMACADDDGAPPRESVDRECDLTALEAAHERALATAAESACSVDADCELVTVIEPCLSVCGIAVAKQRPAGFQAVANKDVPAACNALKAMGCGAPIVDCTLPVARCQDSRCVTAPAPRP